MALCLRNVRVGVLSNIPNLISHIVKRLPEVEPLITDCLATTDIAINEILKSPVEGLSENLAAKIVGDCNILVADPDLVGPIVYNISKVKWMQSTWDGVDAMSKFIKHDKPYPQLQVTRHAVFGRHMAEYVLGHIIAIERNFKGVFSNQERHQWEMSRRSYRLLNKLTIGLIGVGDIGSSVAKAAKHFGMTVHGVVSKEIDADKRNPSIDRYYFSLEHLPEMLQNCDYVCNTLPKTPQTNGALMNDMLKNCKERRSIFINIGRGNVITEDEILKALNSKWIDGAVLDVFEEEPLPKSSPLWDFRNVVITPHCSGLSLDEEIADSFIENLKNYVSGNGLNHIVDWRKGY